MAARYPYIRDAKKAGRHFVLPGLFYLPRSFPASRNETARTSRAVTKEWMKVVAA